MTSGSHVSGFFQVISMSVPFIYISATKKLNYPSAVHLILIFLKIMLVRQKVNDSSSQLGWKHSADVASYVMRYIALMHYSQNVFEWKIKYKRKLHNLYRCVLYMRTWAFFEGHTEAVQVLHRVAVLRACTYDQADMMKLHLLQNVLCYIHLILTQKELKRLCNISCYLCICMK